MDKVDELIIDVTLRQNGYGRLGGRNIAQEMEEIARAEKKIINTQEKLSKSNQKVAQSGFALGKAFRFIGGYMLAKNILNDVVALDSLKASFEGLTGSIEGSKNELKFLRQESDRLGLDFISTATSYKGLYASAKGAGLDEQFTHSLFSSVMQSGVALQSNKQSLAGALLAIEQMISKGKVSMQELRQQLGNALPGAMQIAAKSMGVTTKELEKMLSKGMDSIKFLKAFEKQLSKEYGNKWQAGAKSLQAELNRLNNALFDLKTSFASSGVLSLLSSGIETLSKNIKYLSENLKEVAIVSGSLFALTFAKNNEIFKLFALNLKDGMSLLSSLKYAFKGSEIATFIKSSWALVSPWVKLVAVFELAMQLVKMLKGEWNWYSEAIDKIERWTWKGMNAITGQNKAFVGTFSSDLPQQRTNTNVNQNVTFNINGANNPQVIANEVDRIMTTRLKQGEIY